MPDNREKIEQLEGILSAGVKSLSVDGTNTSFASNAEIQSEIRRLKQEDDTGTYTQRRRVKTIDLGGF